MSYQSYGGYNQDRSNRWQDWANLVLAIWFFFSPWILQFGHSAAASLQPPPTSAVLTAISNAAWNAWVLSVIVFFVSLSAISRMEFWQEWINLVLGAWIFVAPWVLGFANGPFRSASWDHWIVGALIFIFSLLNIMSSRSADTPLSRSDQISRRERKM